MISNYLLRRSAIVCTFLLLVFNLPIVNAQVGIGNTDPDPSSLLEVRSTTAGVLFPRMTSTLRDLIPNPATGLLIFNTTTNTFNYNFGTPGTPNWIDVGATETRSVKYTSTDTTTDINNAAITSIPLFGSSDWNDDTTLFTVVNSSTISVTEAGRYRISVNLLTNGTLLRDQLQLGIYINGSIQGAPFSTNDLSFSALHASVNYSDILELNANDQISVRAEDFIGGGSVTLRVYNGAASNIMIEKIN